VGAREAAAQTAQAGVAGALSTLAVAAESPGLQVGSLVGVAVLTVAVLCDTRAIVALIEGRRAERLIARIGMLPSGMEDQRWQAISAALGRTGASSFEVQTPAEQIMSTATDGPSPDGQ
jgi:hypothetical protein